MALRSSNPLGRIAVEGGKSLAQVKAWFFDRDKVMRAAEKGTLRALSRFGAFVRRRAQTSMRYRSGASSPGSPPSAHRSKQLAALKKMGRAQHAGALLRELLFFAYDPVTRTVVVGPLGFKGSDAPALHEFGGTRAGNGRVIWVTNKPGRDAKGRFVTNGLTKVVLNGSVRYPARPYMRPALAAELPKFVELFRGSIGE